MPLSHPYNIAVVSFLCPYGIITQHMVAAITSNSYLLGQLRIRKVKDSILPLFTDFSSV